MIFNDHTVGIAQLARALADMTRDPMGSYVLSPGMDWDTRVKEEDTKKNLIITSIKALVTDERTPRWTI